MATVALARKLAGILFAMRSDGTPFDPEMQAGVPALAAEEAAEEEGPGW